MRRNVLLGRIQIHAGHKNGVLLCDHVARVTVVAARRTTYTQNVAQMAND